MSNTPITFVHLFNIIIDATIVFLTVVNFYIYIHNRLNSWWSHVVWRIYTCLSLWPITASPSVMIEACHFIERNRYSTIITCVGSHVVVAVTPPSLSSSSSLSRDDYIIWANWEREFRPGIFGGIKDKIGFNINNPIEEIDFILSWLYYSSLTFTQTFLILMNYQCGVVQSSMYSVDQYFQPYNYTCHSQNL